MLESSISSVVSRSPAPIRDDKEIIVFSHQEIMHFRAFGFLALRDLFTADFPDETGRLRAQASSRARAVNQRRLLGVLGDGDPR
jgi:hypothetical protein